MSFIDLASKIRVRCGRKKSGTPTLYSQPGAHTGNTRQYIPGYSDSNIVYLDTVSGNDANSGATELLPKLTYSSAATAAGTTKKIRIINDGAALSTNITKPTEAKRGMSAEIYGDNETGINTWSTGTGLGWLSGKNLYSIVWAPDIGKFVGVGHGSGAAVAGYSTDGIAWTQATIGFGSSNAYDVAYSESLGLFAAVAADGKIETSPDGITWTSRTSGISVAITKIIWSEYFEKFYCCTNTGIIYSDDGVTWVVPTTINNAYFATGTSAIFETGGVVLVSATPGIYRSTDGENFSQVATSASLPLQFTYDGRRLYAINGSLIEYAQISDDIGLTWSNAGAIACINNQVSIIGDEGWIVGANASSGVWYSDDSLATVTYASPSPSVSYGLAYSPSLRRIVCAGGATVKYFSLSANTISSTVAGFSIRGVAFSGTITAYNCTLKAPYTTAALSLNACRLTESGAHIANNAQAHFGTLVEGDFNITCTPASQNAVAINCNTITGRLSVFNASSTLYEQIRDNIIDGGFYASYKCLIQSGNLRGTYTNATLSSKVSNGQDPVFVDETDYKIKRITNGDSQDSPLCNAALYYVNEAGYDRDVGAWSYDDTDNATEYQRTFYLNKPAGNGISITKVQSANAYQGDSGEWDSYNNPARASEHLTLTYQSAVPVDHIDFQDYFESLDDMTCEVNLDPQNDSPSTAFTVNGNHAIGDVVLNIDASTTIRGGVHFTTGGNTYYAVYVTPAGNATKIILDRPLVAAIADNTSITPASVAGDGEYQYLPQNRDGKRPMGQETEYLGGCVFKFVRPWQ